MILIENFRLISEFGILRSLSEGSSPVLGSSMWSRPRGGRNAGQAPVQPSHTRLLKESLGDTRKSLCVWFSGNMTNICKIGLLRRVLAPCLVLSVNPPWAHSNSQGEELTKPLKSSRTPQALNILRTQRAQHRLLKASSFENNYSDEKKAGI